MAGGSGGDLGWQLNQGAAPQFDGPALRKLHRDSGAGGAAQVRSRRTTMDFPPDNLSVNGVLWVDLLALVANTFLGRQRQGRVVELCATLRTFDVHGSSLEFSPIGDRI